MTPPRTTRQRSRMPAWKDVEAEFRLWSFHVYYANSYATEQDLTLRFGKALCASIALIADRDKVWTWWNKYQRNNKLRRRTLGGNLEEPQ